MVIINKIKRLIFKLKIDFYNIVNIIWKTKCVLFFKLYYKNRFGF